LLLFTLVPKRMCKKRSGSAPYSNSEVFSLQAVLGQRHSATLTVYTRVHEPHRQVVRISHSARTFFANFARPANRGCFPASLIGAVMQTNLAVPPRGTIWALKPNESQTIPSM